jgi:phosphoglycerate dehydrogenase-like enzyme
MAGFGAAAASLEEVLRTSQVIVVRFRDHREPGLFGEMRVRDDLPGSMFLLMSRAGVVDFPEA